MNEINDYEREFQRQQPGGMFGAAAQQTQLALTFKLVYGWMCAGLALSGVVAWYTYTSGLFQKVLVGPGLIGCIVAELALVFILSATIQKITAPVAWLMFMGYAALNGLTLSVVFIAYELALVQRVFFITAGMFGGFALFGSLTKSDLSGIGRVCGMALWGLVIASVVNMFMKSSGLDWIISYAGVLIFSGLTIYDTQKIRQIAAAEGTMDRTAIHKVAVLGALSLYLDFINLFIHLLRIFANRSRD